MLFIHSLILNVDNSQMIEKEGENIKQAEWLERKDASSCGIENKCVWWKIWHKNYFGEPDGMAEDD